MSMIGAPFYQLQGPYTRELVADLEQETRQREYISCPAAPPHKGRLRRIGDLHHFVNHNDRTQHIIWGLDIAVHTRVIEDFESQGFTGFRTNAAKVTFQDGQTSDEYREFIVTGWAGIVRREAGMRLLESCAECKWKNYGPISDFSQILDWEQWTGEDFFFVWPLTGNKLCSERAAKWLERSGIRTFQLGRQFTLLEQRKRSLSFGIPRGPLSDYLPQDLAIKYGTSLGLE